MTQQPGTLAIDLRMYKMSGVGRYLQNLLPKLVPLLRADRILLLGESDVLRREVWTQDCRITIEDYPHRIFGISEQAAWFQSHLRRAEALWAPQYNAPFAYRGKLIVTIHDVCHLALPELLRNEMQRWYSRRLLASVAARAAAILCVSDFTADELKARLNVDRPRITVTYPQLSSEWESCPPLPRPSSNRPFLLAVGNLKKNKNFRGLVTAFAAVKQRIPHELVIVGRTDGFRNSDAGFRAECEAADARIRFTGHITDEQLREYYRTADAFVFPSLYEGFGSPIIEAMSQGCPVACSRRSSFPEVAGTAAAYFDPDNLSEMAHVLQTIATDRKLQDELREAGYNRVKKLRDPAWAQKIASVINSVQES